MYANVFAAEKLSAFQRVELVRDVERRQIAGNRARRTPAERAPTTRRLPSVVPLFAVYRFLSPT